MPTSKDYEIGYCKPPKASQFKPGQSGYPSGRPKKTSTSLLEDVIEELQSPITIVEGGKKKKVTKQKMLAKSLVKRAAEGDRHALHFLAHMVHDLDAIIASNPPFRMTSTTFKIIEAMEQTVRENEKQRAAESRTSAGDD